jgi:hypothetical protein
VLDQIYAQNRCFGFMTRFSDIKCVADKESSAGSVSDSAYLVSPYSYFAFLHLRKQRELLAAHGIDVEYVL